MHSNQVTYIQYMSGVILITNSKRMQILTLSRPGSIWLRIANVCANRPILNAKLEDRIVTTIQARTNVNKPSGRRRKITVLS